MIVVRGVEKKENQIRLYGNFGLILVLWGLCVISFRYGLDWFGFFITSRVRLDSTKSLQELSSCRNARHLSIASDVDGDAFGSARLGSARPIARSCARLPFRRAAIF